MRVTLGMPKEIAEHYQEEADDLRTAQERLAEPQPGITSDQLRKNLGRDS